MMTLSIGRQKRNNGFTLIELLLVIVILGVVAALAVPNFGKTLARLELQTTADDLAYLIRYAQSRAVTQARLHRLIFNEQFSQYWLEEAETEAAAKEEASFARIPSRLGKSSSVPSGILIAAKDPAVYFDIDGKIDPLTINLSNQKDCLTVSTARRAQNVEIYSCEESQSQN